MSVVLFRGGGGGGEGGGEKPNVIHGVYLRLSHDCFDW